MKRVAICLADDEVTRLIQQYYGHGESSGPKVVTKYSEREKGGSALEVGGRRYLRLCCCDHLTVDVSSQTGLARFFGVDGLMALLVVLVYNRKARPPRVLSSSISYL
jgi:hypothetical protein